MNKFGDSNHRCRKEHHTIGAVAVGRSGIGQLPRTAALFAGLLALGGCSWFSNDEPAFPPTSGGPSIAAVPNGLPGDSTNAEYSDQELRALLGSAPRPLPPPPAPPKAADTNAPDSTAPQANAPAAAAPTGAAPAGAAAPASQPAAPAVTAPAPAAPAATSAPGSYPDINTVPMQRPTPVPDSDQSTDPTKPKQSSMLTPDQAGPAGKLQVLTTAGSSPAAPTDLSAQTAQSVTGSDDAMFSKPALPPYTGYDQTQKQPQGVPGQALYRSPYVGAGQPTGGNLYYASQSDGSGQMMAAPGGQPVGLVYFGTGSTTMGGSDRQVLRQVADLQRTYGGVIRIIGHASSRTDNMPLDQHHKTNADIAQARAKAVARELVRYGVRPLFVQIAGVSDTQPLYPEFMPAGEAANRRAEIYLSSN